MPLSDGTFVRADDKYIRDSILLPASQIAAGYQPVMPSFEGHISEEHLLQLIAYIKSLGNETPPTKSMNQSRKQNYLNAGHTVKSWLLTTDHKRIGDFVSALDFIFFRHRRRRRRDDAPRIAHAAGRPG